MPYNPDDYGSDEHGGFIKNEALERLLRPYMDPKGSYTAQLHAGAAKVAQERAKIETSKVWADMPPDWDKLGEGVHARPRDIDKVATGCAFVADTLADGGAQHSEPLWKLTMDIAARCKDPEGTAVRLSEGHADYDHDKVILKLAEAQRAREANPKLGFTRCEAVERCGAVQCAACKYRKHDKSPLNTPEANEIVPPTDDTRPSARQQAQEDANYGLIPEAVGEDGKYQPVPGGYYQANDENIERLNRRICRVVTRSDTLLYEVMGPAGHQWRKPQAVESAWAGAYVTITLEEDGADGTAKTKRIALYKWYLDHPRKVPAALPVFKPQEPPGYIGDDEYNMWSGWSVQPDADYNISDPDSNVRVIINHIRDVLCRGQQGRLEYVLRWLAWKVQQPEEPCEAVLVFRSKPEGTGKNIVLDMYARLFGVHGKVFGDKRSVVGEHATNEYMTVGIIDEALFHGDRQTTDLMKSLITGNTRDINPKFQDPRSVKNMGSYIILSNHNIVVTLGSHARRHVILDVDETKVGDANYFVRLKAAINAGTGQFLHFLMNMQLGDWHPRLIIHTEETKLHQIAGMGATLQWLLDASLSGKLLGDMTNPQGNYTYIAPDPSGAGWRYQTNNVVPLGCHVQPDVMFAMFLGWAKSTRVRDTDANSLVGFGKLLTDVIGPHTRLMVTRHTGGGTPIRERPWAYKLPKANDLRELVYKVWGIKQQK